LHALRKSSTVSFSGQRVAAMRARRSSRSASEASNVNGRIAADFSVVMTAMWFLLRFENCTKPDQLLAETTKRET
jgi:hypothetical protein